MEISLNRLYDSLSKNPTFVILTGLASLISLVVSVSVSVKNEGFLLWIIFSICVFILIFLTKLVKQNSRMLRRLDDLNCDVFSQNVDLEMDEDNLVYASQSPIIIVLTSFLTPEIASKKPTVLVQVDFPSQLSLDFNYSTDYISREEISSNRMKLRVTLKSEAIIITIRSLGLSKEFAADFLKSNKLINITFESELLLETKSESILVSI